MGLITEYKCPSCGAPLSFDADTGKVKCQNCGESFLVRDLVEEQESDIKTTEFDWGDYKKTLSGETLSSAAEYHCQSCGAILVTDENTASVTCPYCNNNVVISERVSGLLRPNCLIPFAFSKKEITEKLSAFFASKKYLPDGFADEKVIGKVTGIYVPFWLYDCEISGRVSYNATRLRTYSTPKENVTETSYFLLQRDGRLSFENVPVDASSRIDDDLMDSIEPFDYSKLVDFEEGYLSGYVADKFDSDPDAELSRVNRRTINTTLSEMRKTTAGFTVSSERSNDLRMTDAGVKYALLPVYLLNCEYAGKAYRFAINGQSGKVVGELPIDKKKIRRHAWKVFGIVFLAVAAVCTAVLYFGGAL